MELNYEINANNCLTSGDAFVGHEIASAAIGGKGYISLAVRVRTPAFDLSTAQVTFVVHTKGGDREFSNIEEAVKAYNKSVAILAA